MKKLKRLPKGGKRTPWLYVPEHKDEGRIVPEYFLYLGMNYTYKCTSRTNLPKDAFIVRMTAY